MKVTGWTYWDNPNYINLSEEHTIKAIELTRDIPKIPDRETFTKMSEEEQNKMLQERRAALDAALDCEELCNIDALIQEAYDVVINEIKENGYHFTGTDHQNAECGVPILDDKYILCVSQRTWGGLIASALPDEVDNSEGYGYIKWAWTVPDGELDKVKMPKTKED